MQSFSYYDIIIVQRGKEDKNMTNIFEETYTKIQQLKTSYYNATTDAEREEARKEYEIIKDSFKAKSKYVNRIMRDYEVSRDNGNDILNFDDIIWDDDVEALTACMKENGIKAFTYSCRAASSIDTLWLFKQAGCTIGDLVEINIREEFYGEGYEKGHAFRITLN